MSRTLFLHKCFVCTRFFNKSETGSLAAKDKVRGEFMGSTEPDHRTRDESKSTIFQTAHDNGILLQNQEKKNDNIIAHVWVDIFLPHHFVVI